MGYTFRKKSCGESAYQMAAAKTSATGFKFSYRMGLRWLGHSWRGIQGQPVSRVVRLRASM